jgi:hypothetical protein
VKELQEKNKQITQHNQEEKGDVLSENIPRGTLEQSGLEEQKGDDDDDDDEKEEEKEEDE